MFVVLGACLLLAVVLGVGALLIGKDKDAGGPDTSKGQEPQAGAGAVGSSIVANLLRSRIAANESSAVGSVRNITTAQVTYSTTYPDVGFACRLASLGGPEDGSCSADSNTACLIDQKLASGQKSGYVFTLRGCSGTPAVTYQITAEPAIPGQTGQHAFCSDQSGVIRFTPAGSTVACQGWQPLQ